MNRRHDIDALRALAFALVILYHVGMYYVAGWGWHLKSPHEAAWLQWPMRIVNLWRLDLLFVVSGIAIGFLRRGQGPLGLLRQRSARLLVPLAFGMAVVIPFQPYAQGVANGLVEPGFGRFLARYFTGGPWPAGAFDGAKEGVTWNHLWYLAYLWAYTAALVVLLPLLESAAGRKLRAAFTGLRGAALSLAPVLPMLLYSLTLWPRFAPTHDLIHDGWLHAVYFTLFLYGYWIGLDEGFWAEATRLRWKSLGVALALIGVSIPLLVLGTSQWASGRQLMRLLGDFYMWSAVLAILGWAHLKLNRPWPWLGWANESVYPFYMLHQTLIIVLIVWLAPLALGPAVEPMLLVAGTALGCWGITAVVRRSEWLRPLFGLRRRAKPAGDLKTRGLSPHPSPATPAHPAGRSV